jgi:hypothetical protein
MKLWFLLPSIVLVACGGGSNTSSVSNAAADQADRTGTRTADQRKDSRDQGGLELVEGSQRSMVSKVTRPTTDAGPGQADSASAARSSAAGSSSQASASKPKGKPASPGRSVSEEDAGPSVSTMGAEHAGQDTDPDAGPAASAPKNHGSCCAVSALPGCGDPDLQACVCALQPECCKTAWSQACTFVVAQKYCQRGVRECVCGSAEGQWQQASCCGQSWTDTCESVAINKCSASSGCK